MPGDELIELRNRLTGRWLMPGSEGVHASTIALLADGSMRITLPAVTVRQRTQQLMAGDTITGNWYLLGRAGRRTAGSSVTASVSSASSSFLPAVLRAQRPPPPGTRGPFLVLNIQDLPKAIANVQIFGVRIDIANWVVAADELAAGRHIKLIDVADIDTQITVQMPDRSTQTWRRIE